MKRKVIVFMKKDYLQNMLSPNTYYIPATIDISNRKVRSFKFNDYKRLPKDIAKLAYRKRSHKLENMKEPEKYDLSQNIYSELHKLLQHGKYRNDIFNSPIYIFANDGSRIVGEYMILDAANRESAELMMEALQYD